MTLDPALENPLAKLIQDAIPLVERPFAQLAADLGAREDEVVTMVRQWHADGKLREISAVFEGSSFDYDSALVACEVPAHRIDAVAEIINQHPTVTHNYQRNHAYNLWFTLAVPRTMGLERTLELLATQAGVAQLFPLRRTSTFKVGVNFDLEALHSSTAVKALPTGASVDFGEREVAMVRLLQRPLPLGATPFSELCTGSGLSPDALLDFARRQMGVSLRRYAATFRHRKLGVKANSMTVWSVPEERVAAVGAAFARAPEVSHCYARNTIPRFPYTLYTMIHGPDEATCREVVARLAAEQSVNEPGVLFSSREFKKCRLRYFLPELDAWWEAATRGKRSVA